MLNVNEIEEHLEALRSNGFERIADNIEMFAPRYDLISDYLDRLLFADRGFEMKFPGPVMLSIMKIHQKLPEKVVDVWSKNMLR